MAKEKLTRNNKRAYFLPRTKIGKYSFWLVILGLVLMYSQYWIAMGFNISPPPLLGLLSIILMIIFGITSLISIIKDKEKAIALFISALFGILGILMILGEFIFPH